MDNINNLQQLIAEYDTLQKEVSENEQLVSRLIMDFLQSHCNPTDCKLTGRFTLDRPWAYEQHGKYEVRGRISFLTDDPKRLEKGYDTDFGSDFDMTIYDKGGIAINKGTCGQYTLKDKYQIARDRVLGNLWENHDTIVNIVKGNINVTNFERLCKLGIEINHSEEQLKRAKDEEEYQSIKNKVLLASYLAGHGINDKYENDDYWTRKVIAKQHHYYDIFVIEKITDKSIIGYYENYRWEKKRLDLSRTIYQIKSKQLEWFSERPVDWEEAVEGTSNQ